MNDKIDKEIKKEKNCLFHVKDKVVVITGTKSGIGKTLAKGFVDRGSIVYSIQRIYESKIIEIADRHYVIPCDVLDYTKLQKFINEIDRIDVLINNAGISHSGYKAEEYPYDIFVDTINTNLISVYNLCILVSKKMIEQHSGSIINICSIASLIGMPDNVPYGASKGAVRILTKCLSREWAKYGIRVNNICPGYIITNMTKKSYGNKDSREKRESIIDMNRYGRPDEILGPAIFLASKASSYITGADIVIDGGMTSSIL